MDNKNLWIVVTLVLVAIVLYFIFRPQNLNQVLVDDLVTTTLTTPGIETTVTTTTTEFMFKD